MAGAGWIKIHREITEHWLWDCEFSYAQAWIDLLINACHKPNKLMIKGQIITLHRGQQARSEVTLSREWRWSRGKVRRFLNQCLKDGMITQETTHLTSIITICNYNSFQGVDTANGTPDGTSSDTTNEHLTVHKQEVKNLRSKEIDSSSTVVDQNESKKSTGLSDSQEIPHKADLGSGSEKKVNKNKGTRLSDDWVIPKEWIDWATSEMSVNELAARSEADRFGDYWRSQAGAKGVKANWSATWRNWVRSAIDRNPGIVIKKSTRRAFGER